MGSGESRGLLFYRGNTFKPHARGGNELERFFRTFYGGP